MNLEKFRLPGDGRKWKTVCKQRQSLAIRLAAHTQKKIVYGDVRLRADLPRRTFFRRMADLRRLGLLRSIGRMGYEFDWSGLKTANVALSIDVTDVENDVTDVRIDVTDVENDMTDVGCDR